MKPKAIWWHFRKIFGYLFLGQNYLEWWRKNVFFINQRKKDKISYLHKRYSYSYYVFDNIFNILINTYQFKIVKNWYAIFLRIYVNKKSNQIWIVIIRFQLNYSFVIIVNIRFARCQINDISAIIIKTMFDWARFEINIPARTQISTWFFLRIIILFCSLLYYFSILRKAFTLNLSRCIEFSEILSHKLIEISSPSEITSAYRSWKGTAREGLLFLKQRRGKGRRVFFGRVQYSLGKENCKRVSFPKTKTRKKETRFL